MSCPYLLPALFSITVALGACGEGNGVLTLSAPPAPTLDQQQLASVYAAMNLTAADNGMAVNACGEAIEPQMHSVALGEDIGSALLVVMGGGEEIPGCYGTAGTQVTLLRVHDAGYSVLFAGIGQLALMPESHEGVRDIVLGGPGLEFPVYSWNGTAYAQSDVLDHRKFPAPLH